MSLIFTNLHRIIHRLRLPVLCKNNTHLLPVIHTSTYKINAFKPFCIHFQYSFPHFTFKFLSFSCLHSSTHSCNRINSIVFILCYDRKTTRKGFISYISPYPFEFISFYVHTDDTPCRDISYTNI